MDLYNLGTVPWPDSQLIYHALPRLGREGLVLCQPASPYVCLGFHQDARQEIDLAFCKEHGIPIFRREVGGGAVYLDRGQLFYQIVLQRQNPLVPASKEVFYRRFLEPVVAVYRHLGIAAAYKPVNDIVVGGRKISGNGAADIADAVVLVGNLIMDFNYEMMSRVLRVPDEKYRDKVYKTLGENLTTIRRETGREPSLEELAARLVEHFAPLLGPLTPRTVDGDLRAKAQELWVQFASPAWLHSHDRRPRPGRQVKIAAGVTVMERLHKAPGGLLRATAVLSNNRVHDVHLSGDFFFYPAHELAALEEALEGVEARAETIVARVQEFYQQHSIESPGLQAADFARLLAMEAGD
jgi:lipoate-protein ligase A